MKPLFKYTSLSLALATILASRSFAGALIDGTAAPGSVFDDAVAGTNVTITGTTTINDLANLDGGIAVTTNNFTVATNGDTVVAGTLNVTGDTTAGNIDSTTLDTTGNVDVGGTLDVTGTSSFTGDVTAGNIDSATLDTTGNVDVGGTLDVSGTSSFTGDVTAGNIDSATLDTTGNVDVGGTLNVTGSTTTNNITNNGTLNQTGTSTITGITLINTSLASPTTIGTNGNTTNLNSSVVNIGTQAYDSGVNIGSAQTNTTVTARGGNSTLSVQNNVASLTSSNNGFSTYTNGQVIGTDYTLVNGNAASQALVTGQTTSNVLVGNTLVDGDMYINGTLTYTSSTSATTTVTSGVSELPGATQATIGVVRVDNSGGASVDSNGKISPNGATGPTAGVILTNGYGETHGLAVTESQVTLSGGTRSSSMTLNDNGATFSNSSTGRPVQLHGVADGTSAFDAVNFRQLKEVKRGLAATTAMTNIPAIDMNKKFSVGVGLGGYDEETAFAFGSSMRLDNDFILKASVGHSFGGETSSSNTTWGIGSSFSW